MGGWSDEGRKGDFKGTQKTFGGDGYTHYLVCGDNFRDMSICQHHQTVGFNMCNLFYVNYTLIKLQKIYGKDKKIFKFTSQLYFLELYFLALCL